MDTQIKPIPTVFLLSVLRDGPTASTPIGVFGTHTPATVAAQTTAREILARHPKELGVSASALPEEIKWAEWGTPSSAIGSLWVGFEPVSGMHFSVAEFRVQP